MPPSYEVLTEVKLTETKSRMVFARSWGTGSGRLLFRETEFQFCTTIKFWRRYDNVNVLNTIEPHS